MHQLQIFHLKASASKFLSIKMSPVSQGSQCPVVSLQQFVHLSVQPQLSLVIKLRLLVQIHVIHVSGLKQFLLGAADIQVVMDICHRDWIQNVQFQI